MCVNVITKNVNICTNEQLESNVQNDVQNSIKNFADNNAKFEQKQAYSKLTFIQLKEKNRRY
jgi:hypothetical protein